jgi:hypothetical protein
MTKLDIEVIDMMLLEGASKRSIALAIGVEYSAIHYYIRNRSRYISRLSTSSSLLDIKLTTINTPQASHDTQRIYSYVLGLYLGDGYIDLHIPKYHVYKLRISQDTKYPMMIKEQQESIHMLLNTNVNVQYSRTSNCATIYAYKKDLPLYFPQHGAGLKNTRNVELTPWQRAIVNEYPWEFIKGLIQTDGCYYTQHQSGKLYDMYSFFNTSRYIINDFLWVCNLVGLSPVVYPRLTAPVDNISATRSTHSVTFSKRRDVGLIKQHVGIKT